MHLHQTIAPSTSPQAPPITLSDEFIPAVRGEFYVYSTMLTAERPLYAMMNCRANKDRPITFAGQHPTEVDLVLVGNQICAPNTPPATSLIGALVDPAVLGDTRVAVAKIPDAQFNWLRQQKNDTALVATCRAGTVKSSKVVTLAHGMILAVTTKSGKYGLLRVAGLAPNSVTFDAYHILL